MSKTQTRKTGQVIVDLVRERLPGDPMADDIIHLIERTIEYAISTVAQKKSRMTDLFEAVGALTYSRWAETDDFDKACKIAAAHRLEVDHTMEQMLAMNTQLRDTLVAANITVFENESVFATRH